VADLPIAASPPSGLPPSHADGAPQPASSFDPRQRPRLRSITAWFALIAGLYFGRDVLIPIALALLLVPMLAPPVGWLERLRLGRTFAVIVVVTLTCALLGVLTWLLTQQVADLVTRLPEYKANIVAKVEHFRGGLIEKATDAVEDLKTDLGAVAAEPRAGDARAPQEVRIVPPTVTGFALLMGQAGFVLGPLGTLGIVLLIAMFVLIQRGDLRDRIVHLIGQGHVNVTTQALDEITARVSKFLVMTTILNAIHGAFVGIGLLILDVPNALVWGLAAIVLRFIPYLGPVVAAALPIALSLAVFDGWERPLMVIALHIVLETVSDNVLKPWFLSTSAGVSSLAIVIAALFWAWIWGPIGLLLATPITVVLVVIGRHVPQLVFLNTLFGESSNIDPSVRVYQRLIAMDQNDVGELTDSALAEAKSFVQVCDSVLIPALRLAEFDRHHGTLLDSREQFIERVMREVIDDLAEKSRSIHAKELANPVPGVPPRAEPDSAAAAVRVLCIPAKNELDQVVGLMLREALQNVGVTSEVAAADMLAGEKALSVDEHSADIICISALPPSGLMHARYLGKRLRARHPELVIIVALWGSELGRDEGLASLRVEGPCVFVSTLADARHEVLQRIAPALFKKQLASSDAAVADSGHR
jgi:predicted PurR-regulated permease PerM